MKGNLENLTYAMIIANFKKAILRTESWVEIQQLKSQAIDKIYQVKSDNPDPLPEIVFFINAIEAIAIKQSKQPNQFKIKRQQFEILLTKHLDLVQRQSADETALTTLQRMADVITDAEVWQEKYFLGGDKASQVIIDIVLNSSLFNQQVSLLFNEYVALAYTETLNDFLKTVDSVKTDLKNVLQKPELYLAATKIIDSLTKQFIDNSPKLLNEIDQIKRFRTHAKLKLSFDTQIDNADEKPDSVYLGESKVAVSEHKKINLEQPKTIKVSVETLEKGIKRSLFTLVTGLQNVKDETQVRKLAAVAKVTIYENVSKKYNGATPAYTTLINKEVEKYKDRIDKLVAAKIESIRKLKLSEQKKTASIGLVGVFAAAIHGIYVWFKSDSKPVHVQQPNQKPASKVSNALSIAVERNRMADVIRLLQTMDINTKDTRGMTALHWAVQHQHKDMVELLLARGANRSIVDREGLTPRELHNFTSGHRNYNSEIGLLLDSPVKAQAVDRRSAKPEIQNSSLLRQTRSNTAPCGGRIDIKAYAHLGLLGGRGLKPVKLDKLDSSSVPCVGR